MSRKKCPHTNLNIPEPNEYVKLYSIHYTQVQCWGSFYTKIQFFNNRLSCHITKTTFNLIVVSVFYFLLESPWVSIGTPKIHWRPQDFPWRQPRILLETPRFSYGGLQQKCCGLQCIWISKENLGISNENLDVFSKTSIKVSMIVLQ